MKLLGGGVQPQNRGENLRLEQEERQKDRAARIRATEPLREEDCTTEEGGTGVGEDSSLTCNESAATLAWGKGLKPARTQESPPGRL